MYARQLEKINKLKKFRAKGYSINELVGLFSIPKTTIWHHVHNIKINKKHLKSWLGKRGGSKKKFLLEWEKAKKHAKEIIKNLTKRERIIIAACLYWAEGAKRDFSLSNTDPALIKTFVNCLAELGAEKKMLSVSLRLFEDLNQEEARIFWSKVIGVPKEKIVYIDVRKGKKRGKLPYGMCRIRLVKGGYFLKLLQSLTEIIKAK